MGSKFIGAGLATVAMAGAGVGIGVIFSGLLVSLSRQPSLEKQLFSYGALFET